MLVAGVLRNYRDWKRLHRPVPRMDQPTKSYSPSCDRNREPILALLREHFMDRSHVLEFGSGTGQHAVFFAAALPHLIWRAASACNCWTTGPCPPTTVAWFGAVRVLEHAPRPARQRP